METILIKPYTPSWRETFEREYQQLKRYLGDAPSIEHIGSTSVPGLDAKPIVDILLGFDELRPEVIIPDIASLGYEHWAEDTFQNIRLMFTKRNKDASEPLINIHATIKNSAFWEEQIAFRDKLRSDRNLANEYASLKYKLAEVYKNDLEKYTNGKTDFVKKVLAS